jgi:hypothetical protein
MTKLIITVLVAVHLAVVLWHGSAHSELGVGLSPAQNAFVYLVILVAPILAAALAWTGYPSAGLWVFFLSMLGSFLFGAYFHYVRVSPDNVAHLPDGTPAAHSRFIVSAAVLAAVELAAAIAGAAMLRTAARARQP